MMFSLIFCFLFFSEKISEGLSFEVEKNFVYIQSDKKPSHACILNDIPVENSTVPPRLQCCMHCNTDLQCIGIDIVKDNETKSCRLLYGFPALIPTHATSDRTARYQKLRGTKVGTDSYCSVKLTNGLTISSLCYQGIHQWTLIQRRIDGSENFLRNWMDYENGFGSRESEFWLGNRNIHEITRDGYTHLRIEMMDHDCVWKYAEYSTFHVESSISYYKLHVDGYSGNAEDSMWYHDGMFFSTHDNDNDNAGSYNCALNRRGGWWYNSCHKANLNGEYGNTDDSNGINWYYWKGFMYSMKEVRMMVRRP